jgi:hypothetical protein
MNWSTMKTMTRWGDREVAHWIFTNTPFGEVELLNFQKSGPSEFTIWLELRRGLTIMDPPRFTWWNCHQQDADAIFGIDAGEQTMWGAE